ncbi:MAG: ABC transporter permease subunit, partial [Pirellulales bacterium]|nr:ABC transporter permease subunit [Pirellulales bacterium]
MIRLLVIVVSLLVLAFVPLSCRTEGIKIGSKKFTESVVLGEMAAELAEDAQTPATHYRELGGTQLVFQALLSGDIDLYPEYTGTIAKEILSDASTGDVAAMRAELEKRGVRMSEPLGFNNTYVLAMSKPRAKELGITKISDLVRYPDLAFGFSNEFMERGDGWPNLQKTYGLPQKKVAGLDHDLAYRQLRLGAIDVIDAYATDAKIEKYDLELLKDDRQYFPRYDSVLLFREDLADRMPSALESIRRLEGAISASNMTKANARVEFDKMTESQAAGEFLSSQLGIKVETERNTVASRITQRTIEHLDLVRKSLIPAILIAIPLGVLAAKHKRTGQLVLATVSIIQTIPSLALLVMLMPIMAYFGLASVGLGSATAVTALLLYSLLPIVRNTYAGLNDISADHHDAASALGLPPAFRLFQIELPLASRSILAGIKTAAVI